MHGRLSEFEIVCIWQLAGLDILVTWYTQALSYWFDFSNKTGPQYFCLYKWGQQTPPKLQFSRSCVVRQVYSSRSLINRAMCQCRKHLFVTLSSPCLRSSPQQWWPTPNTLISTAASRRSSTRSSGLWCTGSPFSTTTWAESPSVRSRSDRSPTQPSMVTSMTLMDSCKQSLSMKRWCGGRIITLN